MSACHPTALFDLGNQPSGDARRRETQALAIFCADRPTIQFTFVWQIGTECAKFTLLRKVSGRGAGSKAREPGIGYHGRSGTEESRIGRTARGDGERNRGDRIWATPWSCRLRAGCLPVAKRRLRETPARLAHLSPASPEAAVGSITYLPQYRPETMVHCSFRGELRRQSG